MHLPPGWQHYRLRWSWPKELRLEELRHRRRCRSKRFLKREFPDYVFWEKRRLRKEEEKKRIEIRRQFSLARLEGKETVWPRVKRLLRAPSIMLKVWRQQRRESEGEPVMSGGEGEVVEFEEAGDDDDDDVWVDVEEEPWLGDYTEVLEEYLVE